MNTSSVNILYVWMRHTEPIVKVNKHKIYNQISIKSIILETKIGPLHWALNLH